MRFGSMGRFIAEIAFNKQGAHVHEDVHITPFVPSHIQRYKDPTIWI